MRFVADEGVERQIIERLRKSGFTILYMPESGRGTDDDVILDLANKEDAVLITADKDFGELVFRQRLVTAGVVLIRLAGLSPAKKAEIVSQAINQHISKLYHAFTVIAPGTIRIRRDYD